MPNYYSFNVKCPKCEKSLMDPYHQLSDHPSIRVKIKTQDKEGLIRLCSLYGCYDHEANIDLKSGEAVDFYCPHCEYKLNKEESNCKACDAELVAFELDFGGEVKICSREGCKQHQVAFEDLSHALHVLYDKYGFGIGG